jgi:hypothetical protein
MFSGFFICDEWMTADHCFNPFKCQNLGGFARADSTYVNYELIYFLRFPKTVICFLVSLEMNIFTKVFIPAPGHSLLQNE